MYKNILAALVLVPGLAMAMPYNFSSVDGLLNGRFTIDDTAPVTTISSPSSGAVGGYVTAPSQTIAATFGEFSFNGLITLYFDDVPAQDVADDSWIVRAKGTSNSVDGLFMTNLSLFVFGFPTEHAGHLPPAHGFAPDRFYYGAGSATAALSSTLWPH